MRLAFFSSVLNHHQLPLSLEFEKLLGKGNYVFVASMPILQERIDLGYTDFNSMDFVLRSYESEENKKLAMHIAIEFDVVVFGVAENRLVKAREKIKKLTFLYKEHLYKGSRFHAFNPQSWIKNFWLHTWTVGKNTYMLCASAYTAGDYRLFGAYRNRCLKWGYFTEFIPYQEYFLFNNKNNEPIKLLWVGRFIKWKRPELAYQLAKFLKEKSVDFHLDFIGIGPELQSIIDKVRQEGLSECISFHYAMPSEKVRAFMLKANIFLFTSTRKEGWGAVLNEALNSGCAVVANKNIGSVPYLIKEAVNGYIYSNEQEFLEKVITLIEDKNLRDEFTINGYNTIANEWNPKNAAEQLIKLSSNLLNNKEPQQIMLNDNLLSIDKNNL